MVKVNLERILEIARRNKQKTKDGRIALTPADFIDLINSKGKIVYLNKEISLNCYEQEARFSGFVFKTYTRRKIYDL